MVDIYIVKINNRCDNMNIKYNDLSKKLIKILVETKYNIQINDKYEYNPYGKPYLKDYPDIHFNISHSEEYLVCVLSDYQVGVDIEKIKSFDLRELPKSELKEVMKTPNSLDKFYEHWTIKESYLKYKGIGLSGINDKFIIKKNTIIEKSHTTYYRSYDLIPNYKLSVCSSINRFNETFTYYDFDLFNNSFTISALS